MICLRPHSWWAPGLELEFGLLAPRPQERASGSLLCPRGWGGAQGTRRVVLPSLFLSPLPVRRGSVDTSSCLCPDLWPAHLPVQPPSPGSQSPQCWGFRVGCGNGDAPVGHSMGNQLPALPPGLKVMGGAHWTQPLRSPGTDPQLPLIRGGPEHEQGREGDHQLLLQNPGLAARGSLETLPPLNITDRQTNGNLAQAGLLPVMNLLTSPLAPPPGPKASTAQLAL